MIKNHFLQKKQHSYVLLDTIHTLVFQTLNVVIFHPLKAHFNRINQNLKLATPNGRNQSTAARSFPRSFSKLWESMTVGLIKTCFQKCDIFSLGRNAIRASRLSYNSWDPSPPSNSSHPNPPRSADKNTSLVAVLILLKRLVMQVQVPQPQSTRFSNSVIKGWEDQKFCSRKFFNQVMGTWGGVFLTTETFLRA